MITIDAEILELDLQKKIALVRPIHHSQCNICNHQGCGVVLITQLFTHERKNNFYAKLPLLAINLFQKGHKVSVEIEDLILWKSLFLGYIFPLIMLLLGAGIGNYFFSEFLSILGSLIGFILSLIVLKTYQFNQTDLPIIKYHIL